MIFVLLSNIIQNNINYIKKHTQKKKKSFQILLVNILLQQLLQELLLSPIKLGLFLNELLHNLLIIQLNERLKHNLLENLIVGHYKVPRNYQNLIITRAVVIKKVLIHFGLLLFHCATKLRLFKVDFALIMLTENPLKVFELILFLLIKYVIFVCVF